MAGFFSKVIFWGKSLKKYQMHEILQAKVRKMSFLNYLSPTSLHHHLVRFVNFRLAFLFQNKIYSKKKFERVFSLEIVWYNSIEFDRKVVPAEPLISLDSLHRNVEKLVQQRGGGFKLQTFFKLLHSKQNMKLPTQREKGERRSKE